MSFYVLVRPRSAVTSTQRLDLDTPYHLDHVRDNRMNAGCMRCATFMEARPSSYREGTHLEDAWRAHRRNLLGPTVDLSPRQLEVAKAIASGDKIGVLAHRLGISRHTIYDHLQDIRHKLDLDPWASREEVYRALGWLNVPE